MYPCVFIGYSLVHKGDYYLDPKTNKAYILRHLVFDESVFPYRPISTETKVDKPLDIIEFPTIDEWLAFDNIYDEFHSNQNTTRPNLLMQTTSIKKHVFNDLDFLLPSVQIQDEHNTPPSQETPNSTASVPIQSVDMDHSYTS